VFCSGGNLTDYAAMTSPEEGKRVNRKIAAILDEVSRLPVPTVCAVTGDCFGGGVELISAFDVVLSVPHAMFALWQRKIGLSFGWGGGKRLESRLGIHKLRQLALSANSFSALEAMKLGLIDAVSIDERLLEDARACAMGMSALPKAPVASLKSYTPEKEKEIFESLWLNEEHAKVLAGKKK
jgi:enoyl-CoA hydratase/carnithine racemase